MAAHVSVLFAAVGRCANRIREGSFSIEGKPYQVAINNPPNALHGGEQGFDKRIWSAEQFQTADGDDGVRLSRTSKDGEEVLQRSVHCAC